VTPLAGLPTVLADSDAGKGSPIGLLVVLLLIVAVYFLYRSMNRHLRKVPPQFDQPQPSAPDNQSAAESSSNEPERPERPEQDG
jgi:type II secretory pathway component PulC